MSLLSLRASSPIWASEASRARTRERAAKLAAKRGASLSQIGELARRLVTFLFKAFNGYVDVDFSQFLDFYCQ